MYFHTGIYAMIDLYGQCVQISIYDEVYQGSQVVQIPGTEQTVVDAVPVTDATTEGTSTGMCLKQKKIPNVILPKKKETSITSGKYCLINFI